MAVAGGGVPAQRVSIRRRHLVQHPPAHNVQASAVYKPDEAAALMIADPKAYIYVYVVDFGGMDRLYDLLLAAGVIDPFSQSAWHDNVCRAPLATGTKRADVRGDESRSPDHSGRSTRGVGTVVLAA